MLSNDYLFSPPQYTSFKEKSWARTRKSALFPGVILPISSKPIIAAGFEVAQETAPAKGIFLKAE